MKKIKRRVIWAAIAAYATVFFLTSDTLLAFPLLMEPSSVFCLPVTAGIAFLYLKAFFPFDRRRILISFVSGILMGLMFILGVRYSVNEVPAPSAFSFLTALLAAALLFSAFISLLLKSLSLVPARTGSAAAEKTGVKTLAALFAVTFAVYAAAFLAVYPGIYSYDASVQVLQFFGDNPVTSHHPILHTLFLCGSLKAGEVLFHSYQAGLALYSLIQITFMAAVITFVLYRMVRRNVPNWLVILSWLFLAANPYMQVLALLTTKDVLFGAFFLMTFDFSIDMVSDPERFFSSRIMQAGFFLSAFFSCLFRNQGIHVFIFFSLFALVFFIRHKNSGKARKLALRWTICAAALSAVYLTLNGPVLTAFGVEKGDAREMLSVPMQQLARVWHEAPESLTREEKAYIESLILPEALDGYVRVNADPVKSGFQTNVVKEDPLKFVGTWAGIGAKEPLIYLDSFLMGNWGYWYPGETQYWISYIMFDGAFLEDEYNVLHIFRNSRFPWYNNYLRTISLTPEFEKIPLLSLILNQAFPFWLMLAAGTVSIYRKQTCLLVSLSLILGYWGTLLLGPVTGVRYAFPLMLCVPLLFELFMYGTAGRVEN